MAKFSAYMRGITGATGDAAGFGNITVSTSSIPSTSTAIVTINSVTNSPNIAKDFNFYFGIPKGEAAGIYTGKHTATVTAVSYTTPPTATITASGSNTAKKFTFNFKIPKGMPAGYGVITVTTSTLASNKSAIVSLTTNGPEEAKNFNFNFGIPVGKPAGFGNISVSTISISSNLNADVIINPIANSPETAKEFDFTFKIPRGVAAGIVSSHNATISYSTAITQPKFTASASGQDTEKKFTFNLTLPEPIINGTQIASIRPLNSASTPTISISTTPDSTAAQKKLSFDFGIPVGVPAGFGTPTASVSTLPSNLNPTVNVVTSGPETAKKFDFHFGIPAAEGSGYREISFTTASSNTEVSWDGNILKVNRKINGKDTKITPINIYKKVNNEYKAIAADFEIEDNYIKYNADEKFEGIIHCMAIA